MDEALRVLHSGAYHSIRQVATDHAVPRTSLTAHFAGTRLPRAQAHQKEQRLSTREERWLVQWVLNGDSIGQAPSLASTREMAAYFTRALGDEAPIGRAWVHAFKKRNPEIKSMIGKRIEASRITGTSQELIGAFFERLCTRMDEYRVDPANIWNMDEHGTAMGRCTNHQVLADARKRRTYKTEAGDRE